MDKKPLVLSCAFGRSRAEALLLAQHPDEGWDSTGKVRSNARTFVLTLDGTRASFHSVVPDPPMLRTWHSRGSGAAYCSLTGTNKLRIWHDGAWTEEVYRDAPPVAFKSIFGFPGERPKDDQLFVGTSDAVHVRVKGKWSAHKFDGGSDQIHGRDPSRVFVGGDELACWNGKKLSVIKPPPDDMFRCVWVTKDGKLIGGNHHINILNDDGSWGRQKGPALSLLRMMEFQDTIYASGAKGVLRIFPEPRKLVKAVPFARFLWNVGDALVFDTAREGPFLFDGKKWAKITMPAYKKGEKV
jgi:hypothetical protein